MKPEIRIATFDWTWRGQRYGWAPPFGRRHKLARERDIMFDFWDYLGFGFWRHR